MTSKKRILAAMNLEPVDKIPVMCQMSIGHMLLQLKASPSKFWFDKNIFADGLIKLREQYGFDGILVSLHGHNPEWKKNIKNITNDNDGETIEWMNGDTTICPFNELPREYKLNPSPQYDLDDIDINLLPKKINYIPVSQGLHFHLDQDHMFDVFHDIIARVGNTYSIHGEITAPLDYLLDLVGIQNSLMGFICDPYKVKIILQHFAKQIIQLSKEMCKTGIDAIKISSPFAGAGFISPDHYKEFVLPYEKEIASAIKNEGVKVYTHTCGEINDRLELLFDTGINGIECLDPAPLGNVELEDAITRISHRGFIKGNIDSVSILLNSSEETIREKIKQIIKVGKRTNGFILSTACSIAPSVSKEKILILKEIIDKCEM